MELFKSLNVRDDPEWSVITGNDKFGYGVFSWHHHKGEAEWNAGMTNGIVLPVDYHDGELIMPYLAQAIINRHLE